MKAPVENSDDWDRALSQVDTRAALRRVEDREHLAYCIASGNFKTAKMMTEEFGRPRDLAACEKALLEAEERWITARVVRLMHDQLFFPAIPQRDT